MIYTMSYRLYYQSMAWWWGKGAGKDGKAQPEARWQPKDDVVCDSSMRKPRAVNFNHQNYFILSLSLSLSLSPSLRVKYAPEIMLYYGLLSIWGPYRELFFLGWDILTIPRAFNPFFHQNWDCHPQSRWRRSGVAPGWAAIKIIKARVSDAWVNSGSRPLWYTFSVGQDQASYTILIRDSLVP